MFKPLPFTHVLRSAIAISVLVGGFGDLAQAQEMERSRAPLSGREIERGLVVPKGWVLAEARYFHDRIEPTVGGSTWKRDAGLLQVRHGLLPRMELWLGMRVEQLEHTSSAGARTARAGFVDPTFGVRWSLVAQETPGRWLAAEVWTKAPAGSDGAGGDLPLSTGTADVGMAFHGRLRGGGLRNDLSVTVLRRFAGVSHLYAAPVLKPGDELRMAEALVLQAGPFYGGVGCGLDVRGTSAIGAELPTLRRVDLRPLTNSQGWSVSLDWQLAYQVSRGATLALNGVRVVANEGHATLGLQDHGSDRSKGLGFALKAAL